MKPPSDILLCYFKMFRALQDTPLKQFTQWILNFYYHISPRNHPINCLKTLYLEMQGERCANVTAKVFLSLNRFCSFGQLDREVGIIPSRANAFLPLKLSVNENGLSAETGPTIKKLLLWNWHIFHPTSPHDELPLHQRKENNSI